MIAIELGGAFLMGLMGSVHCATMCGPIGAVLCATPRGGGSAGLAAGLPQLGRLCTYGALGALAGLAGGTLADVIPLRPLQVGVRILSAVLLIAVGLYAAGLLRAVFAGLERMVSPLFRRAAARSNLGASRPPVARFLSGLVWGLVPCGLVYGALGLAVLSGSPGSGIAVMLTFGAGTIPALLLIGVFAGGFQRTIRDPRVRRSAGLLLTAAGTLHLALAFRATLVPPELLRESKPVEAGGGAEPHATPSCH